MKKVIDQLRNKRLLLALAGLMFISFTASAQLQTLTLKDALKYALKNKAEVRKASLDVENSQYQVDEVKARALPQVSGTSSMTYNPILQKSALPGDIAGKPGTTLIVPFGQKWNANVGVALSQTLYDQSVVTGLKAQKSTKEYYALAAKLTDEQVIEQVAKNYYQVLVYRQKMVVVDSNILYTTQIKEVINGQFKNGLAKKIDLDRTVVKISNLTTQRQQLMNNLQLQENQLKFYMGMPIQNKIDIPQSEYDAIVPNYAGLLQTADVTKHPEYLMLKKQSEILTLQKAVSQSEYYPTLSLSGNYNYQGVSNQFPIAKGVSQNAYWNDYASVGLNLKIPIFNGFSTRAKLKQADISIKKLNEDISNRALSLSLDIENGKTQIINSLIVLKNQQENIALAQQVFSDTKNNYNSGLAALTDLLDATSSLTESQNNYSGSILDYRLAEIQLIKAQGNLTSLLK